MPELSAPFEAGSSSPSLVVQVSKYPINWDTSREFEEVTGKRLKRLGDRVLHRAWFLNPMFTVYAHTPSAAFFRAAFRARTQWLRILRQTLGNRGLRLEKQQSRERGRRAVYREAAGADPGRILPDTPGRPVRVDRLTREQLAEAMLTGRLYQQCSSSGIMFIEGKSVPPRTWRTRADQAFHPGRPRVAHRHVDLAAVKDNHDLEPLKLISLEALQAHLDQHPGHVAFVTPHATLSAPSISLDFYSDAKKLKAAWCHLLARTLGTGPLRRLRKAADPTTLALAIDGTLMVGDRVYLPGLWPILTPPPKAPNRPFPGSPAAPIDTLGPKVVNDETKFDTRTETTEGTNPA